MGPRLVSRRQFLITTRTPCRIVILALGCFGPKNDGTYIVEFRTAEGEALAISPRCQHPPSPAIVTRVTSVGRGEHALGAST
jgi:hypothetical protein